ncbi:hypothetical protein [Microbacterium sp. SS28]|uniref:hypothetical protein n=1 Tax=Microbacterium sp. SS28 TaxID=2919948 RepID=UPI001FA9E438|nr:hypothetical protein [Microbacterium sp. SS28]
MTPRRLRAKDLERPFRGTRIAPTLEPEEPDLDDWLSVDEVNRRLVLREARALATVMAPWAFFAGRTALALYGAPIDPGPRLEVAACPPHSAPQRRGIRRRKVAEHLVHVSTHEGLPVASPASAWAMLGRELTVRELVTVGDALVRVTRDDRGRPRPGARVSTIGRLRVAAETGRRRGAIKLLDALEQIRVGSSSPLESEYRMDAAAAGLPEPELDVEIRDDAGRLCGISEIVYRGQRTIVEIEGDHHRTNRTQWDRDIEKYHAYAACGWEVVRLTARHVRGHSPFENAPYGVQLVKETLLRRGWDPDA